MIPWMWNSGMTVSERSAAVSSSDAAMLRAERGQVALAERHDLRPRRRAGRVQHERLVVGRPVVGRRGAAAQRGRAGARATSSTGRPPSPRTSIDDRPSGVAAACAAGALPSRHERRGAEVVEVEAELVLAVLRVERRRAADRHGRQQRPAPSPARWAGRSRSGRPGRARPHGRRSASRSTACARVAWSIDVAIRPSIRAGPGALRRQQGGNGVDGAVEPSA